MITDHTYLMFKNVEKSYHIMYACNAKGVRI